jgi:hypothetical protein
MIIVVGAGIAGSCLARHLHDRGLDCRVVSAGRPNSTAAAALLRRGYHHGDQLALFDRSLELLKRWSVDVHSGGWVTNYRKPHQHAREEADWHVLNPLGPLVEPDIIGTAYRHAAGVLVDGSRWSADLVLWATGADRGTGITHGVTWTHKDPSVLTAPKRLRLHHVAPYKTIVAALVGGQVRLGSSSASSEATAHAQAEKMLTAAYEVGMIRSLHGWLPEHGLRCRGTQEISEGIHRAVGGFHRTGYAMAPAATERIVEALL